MTENMFKYTVEQDTRRGMVGVQYQKQTSQVGKDISALFSMVGGVAKYQDMQEDERHLHALKEIRERRNRGTEEIALETDPNKKAQLFNTMGQDFESIMDNHKLSLKRKEQIFSGMNSYINYHTSNINHAISKENTNKAIEDAYIATDMPGAGEKDMLANLGLATKALMNTGMPEDKSIRTSAITYLHNQTNNITSDMTAEELDILKSETLKIVDNYDSYAKVEKSYQQFEHAILVARTKQASVVQRQLQNMVLHQENTFKEFKAATDEAVKLKLITEDQRILLNKQYQGETKAKKGANVIFEYLNKSDPTKKEGENILLHHSSQIKKVIENTAQNDVDKHMEFLRRFGDSYFVKNAYIDKTIQMGRDYNNFQSQDDVDAYLKYMANVDDHKYPMSSKDRINHSRLKYLNAVYGDTGQTAQQFKLAQEIKAPMKASDVDAAIDEVTDNELGMLYTGGMDSALKPYLKPYLAQVIRAVGLTGLPFEQIVEVVEDSFEKNFLSDNGTVGIDTNWKETGNIYVPYHKDSHIKTTEIYKAIVDRDDSILAMPKEFNRPEGDWFILTKDKELFDMTQEELKDFHLSNISLTEFKNMTIGKELEKIFEKEEQKVVDTVKEDIEKLSTVEEPAPTTLKEQSVEEPIEKPSTVEEPIEKPAPTALKDLSIKQVIAPKAEHGKRKTTTTIIFHRTAGSKFNPKDTRATEDGMAGHFTIGKDGTIYQQVGHDQIAHHGGRGRDGSDLNLSSIGIEIVGAYNQTGGPDEGYFDELTEPQKKSLAILTKSLMAEYNLKTDALVAHGVVGIKKPQEGVEALKYFKQQMKD